jgi:TolB-like protein/DNA-binding winged helix-turn-helix (wHTH) protein
MSMVPALQTRVLRFATFELDLEAGELRKRGLRQKLTGQPFKVLRVLLEHPQEVVTREALQRRIWPQDTSVDYELALRKAVTRLRDALGDSADSPRFIETIPRLGYRFIAPVTGDGHAVAVAEAAPVPPAIEPWWRSRSLQVGVALGLGPAVVILAILGLVPHRFRWRIGPKEIRSLAVLPLQSLSADPNQQYFTDGMTDALITELAQSGSVRVISRTSSMQYKQTKKSLPEIARELKVDGIVEGTVQRFGDRVRITVQLIRAASDEHLWANTYERDASDVLAFERDVAADAARLVQAHLATQR